jgi:hypothetical protein
MSRFELAAMSQESAPSGGVIRTYNFQMTFRRNLATVTALSLLFSVAGCASADHQSAKSVPPSRTPSTSGPLASLSPGASAPSASATIAPNQYITDPALTDIPFAVELPVNGPPQQYAEGTAIFENSRVVAYRVAPGDIYDYICDRFGLSDDGYILAINQVRRGNAALEAGDVLNLSASTMHKYGSVGGKVLDNPDPSHMPPQEP